MEIGHKKATRIVISVDGAPAAIIYDGEISYLRKGIEIDVERPAVDQVTLEDIRNIPGEILLPRHVAPLLGCQPYAINCACARGEAASLGFPVIVVGTRVKIPKQAFIRFFEGKSDKEDKKNAR